MTDRAGFTAFGEWDDRDSKQPFRVLSAHDLLTLQLPPRDLVVAPWLPSKGLAMLYGPRGIGKTHLVLGVAYAAATGGSFLRWSASRPRRVLILDGEMPARILQERLAVIAAAASVEPPAPDYLRVLALDLQERGLDLGDAGDQRALDAELGEAEVILVDNISTLVRAGRENEAESWLPVQEWALVQRRAGRCVVFIHHAGKSGQQRGTSRREDVLDAVISLRLPSDYHPDQGARFEVHYEKSRGFYGEDAKPFEAALGPGGWTTRDPADPNMARVVVLTEQGLSARKIAEETGISKTQVSRLQQWARELGMLGTGRA